MIRQRGVQERFLTFQGFGCAAARLTVTVELALITYGKSAPTVRSRSLLRGFLPFRGSPRTNCPPLAS